MKKILLFIFLLSGSFGYSQLNSKATFYKDNQPDLYKSVRDRASDKWGNDYQMVVYEINQQIDAFDKVRVLLQNEGADSEILLISMRKWSDDEAKFDRFISMLDDEPAKESIWTLWFDWQMVVYEYETQSKAKSYID